MKAISWPHWTTAFAFAVVLHLGIAIAWLAQTPEPAVRMVDPRVVHLSLAPSANPIPLASIETAYKPNTSPSPPDLVTAPSTLLPTEVTPLVHEESVAPPVTHRVVEAATQEVDSVPIIPLNEVVEDREIREIQTIPAMESATSLPADIILPEIVETTAGILPPVAQSEVVPPMKPKEVTALPRIPAIETPGTSESASPDQTVPVELAEPVVEAERVDPEKAPLASLITEVDAVANIESTETAQPVTETMLTAASKPATDTVSVELDRVPVYEVSIPPAPVTSTIEAHTVKQVTPLPTRDVAGADDLATLADPPTGPSQPLRDSQPAMNTDGHSTVQKTYLDSVLIRLNQFKRYPPIARRRGVTGVAKVRFTILADGHLESVELVASSGSSRLDREALRMFYRASPFAPLPHRLGKNRFDLQVPIVFSLK